jgi:hypothetical protein
LQGGTTEFEIKEVLKDHEILKKRNVVTLPRYLPNQQNEWVVFCDVYKGLIDPYRGVEMLPKSDLVPYLKGALKIKGRKAPERLRYCFDYLTSADFEVSMDAYREFAKADYDDYKDMAKSLPADTIAGWLKDANTPSYRFGLYGSLLGLCGKAEHGKLLREMLDDAKVRKSSGIDGVLVGYALIEHREGKKSEPLAYFRKTLENPKEEFLMRYAVLRTLRFFWSTRPDVFSRDEIVGTVALTLQDPHIADFGIEDLRKWQRWDQDKVVLGLFDKKTHDARIVKRAILRYALQCPTQTCRAFVQEQEKRDREWVNDTRELLELEATIADEKNTVEKK